MRKYLGRFHASLITELLHLPPDTAAVQGLSTFSDKDTPGSNLLLLCVVQQQFSQLTGNEDRPGFTLTANCDFAAPNRLHRKKPQLRHPDASTTDRLQNQIKLLILPGCFQQAHIFCLGQFLIFGAIGLPLEPNIFTLQSHQP